MWREKEASWFNIYIPMVYAAMLLMMLVWLQRLVSRLRMSHILPRTPHWGKSTSHWDFIIVIVTTCMRPLFAIF